MKPLVRTLLAVALSLAALPASAQDFPQWRGPGRDGVVTSFAVPKTWPKELKQEWKATVGEGHATPVVADGKVYVFARQKDDEVVLCLGLEDGKEVWKKSYPAPYEMHPAARGHGKGPKATPCLKDGRLYTFGISGILSCFDAKSGDLKWRHEFGKRYKATSPLYGTAMSPLVEDGLCVAHVGGHDKGALTAFDAESGKEKWSHEGDGPGYASPVLATLAGERQLVTQTQTHVVGVSWPDGRPLWKVPFTTQYDQNSVTPVIHKDLVIFSGYNQPVAALRVEKKDGKLTATEAWRNKAHPMYLSSPVLKGTQVFGMSHRGSHLFCLDAESGKTLWEDDRRRGENVALLLAGDVLLALTADAKLIVAKAGGEKFEPVAEYKVAESPTWAHPVPVGRRVLVKDREAVTAWAVGE
jgi:outer membrane protein assembly factor BamB